ncbi:macrophage colony-stimulating factor 1a [Polypterus senegalus]|uniref:macrophage colony-stimulating factor 1a n=1 Tax=Polypterus senegalus TaxID=55291 RepID=UPI00196675F4|nr:macrophage colony-stimulating factor 1a [Polypterus senegalus]
MNTHTSAHTLLRAKAGKLWIPVLLFFPLAFAYVPDTCRNSMKQEHLSILDRLIANQLVNSCNIRYKFIEESQLSKTCFVKAVFPKILDLLNDHFKYGKNSSNGKDVQLLKDLIGNIYKIRCIPPIDLEKEDNPEKFWKDFDEPPQAALRRIRSAAAIYLNLLATYRKGPNWECSEYDAEVQTFTTGSVSSTSTTPCRCSCPAVPGATAWESIVPTAARPGPSNPFFDVTSNQSPETSSSDSDSEAAEQRTPWKSNIDPARRTVASSGTKLRKITSSWSPFSSHLYDSSSGSVGHEVKGLILTKCLGCSSTQQTLSTDSDDVGNRDSPSIFPDSSMLFTASSEELLSENYPRKPTHSPSVSDKLTVKGHLIHFASTVVQREANQGEDHTLLSITSSSEQDLQKISSVSLISTKDDLTTVTPDFGFPDGTIPSLHVVKSPSAQIVKRSVDPRMDVSSEIIQDQKSPGVVPFFPTSSEVGPTSAKALPNTRLAYKDDKNSKRKGLGPLSHWPVDASGRGPNSPDIFRKPPSARIQSILNSGQNNVLNLWPEYESSSLANHEAERGLREGSREEQTSFKMAFVGLAVLSCLLLIVIAYLLVKKGKEKDPRGQLYKELPLTSCAYDTEMQPFSPLDGADNSEVLRKTSERTNKHPDMEIPTNNH